MKEKIKCPFWNEKKGQCKVLDILLDLTEVSKQVAKTVEAHTPPKTSLGPIPEAHGMAEGQSSIIGVPLPPVDQGRVSKFTKLIKDAEQSFLKSFHPPTDSQPAHFEELEKKQKYWDKELKKMDEEKK